MHGPCELAKHTLTSCHQNASYDEILALRGSGAAGLITQHAQPSQVHII